MMEKMLENIIIKAEVDSYSLINQTDEKPLIWLSRKGDLSDLHIKEMFLEFIKAELDALDGKWY